MIKRCWECGGWIHNKSVDDSELVEGCNVVTYPVESSDYGELIHSDPEALVYLCDHCYEENKNKVVEIHGDGPEDSN